MKFTASQIAHILEGRVEGDCDAAVFQLSKIEEGVPGSISFLANPKYTPHIYTTQASIVIVSEDFVAEKPIETTLIRVKDAYQSFTVLLSYYDKLKGDKLGVEQPSYIADSAQSRGGVFI